MRKSVAPLLAIVLMCITSHSLSATHPENLIVKWRFKTEGALRSDAVINGSTIFIASTDGQLYALRKNDGKQLWAFKTGGAIAGEPVVTDKLVIVVSRDGMIYAINRNTGQLDWTFSMQPERAATKAEWQYFTAAPVIDNSKVYVGSGDGSLYALHQKNGQLVWKFQTQGQIRATPLLHEGTIYQPSNDGIVYVLDAATGHQQWIFKTEGHYYNSEDFNFDRKSIFAAPIIMANSLIIGARDGNVYAIDLQTKMARWKFSYGTPWAMSTAADEGAVYVGWSTNNRFSAIDLASGKEKWQFSTGAHNYTTPLVKDKAIIFGSADGTLYQLDKVTGNKIAQYTVGHEIFSSPVYDQETDTIFFGSDDGNLYAAKKGQAGYKAVYQPAEITGIMQYLVVDPKVTPYLSEHGYTHLHSDAQLKQFIEARIADNTPSVIVFALPMIPNEIMSEKPAQGLMHQYLMSGGKVMWFSDPPNYYSPNEADNDFIRNPKPGTELLDVSFTALTDSGNYFSQATQEGKNWGLPQWLKATSTPVAFQDSAPKAVVPLAIDEFGRIALWVKLFSKKPGTGFVSMRTWGWNIPIKDEDLKLIDQLARYGLD